jgi:integrase/recombinase XerD
MSALAPTLQTFFTDYMQRQRKASPHTIAAYRDAVRLLLAFTASATASSPTSSTSPISTSS